MPLNIEDYAIIGDCETAALVGRDLSIDWLCWPRFDSSACFANLLGTKDNGRWSIEPADPGAKMTRNYRGHSLILETTIETTDGVAVVTDFMPTRMRGSRLIRRVRGVRGSVKFRTELIMRFGYGSIVPWVSRCDDGSLQAVAGPDRLVLRAPLSLRPRGHTHVGEFTVTAGETTDFTMSYSVSYQDVPRAIDPDQALEKTERSWSTWQFRERAVAAPVTSVKAARSFLILCLLQAIVSP